MDVSPDRPPCHPVSPDRGDLRQVRLLTDDLRREIRQLRLEEQELTASIRRAAATRPPERGRDGDDEPVAKPSPVAPAHRPYAPVPIGRIIARVEIPVPPPAVVPIENWYHVTNLGTLLDVLA
jgi:hypothetical protein